MSITTRQGDGGATRLASGERVSKADPRLEALGDLDELVSALGLARARLAAGAVCDAVLALQRDLFTVGADLADPARTGVDDAFLASMETRCAELEAGTPAPAGFILPGETEGGAALDFARCVARRFERRLAALAGESRPPPPRMSRWANRASDYLWLLARAAERTSRPLKGA